MPFAAKVERFITLLVFVWYTENYMATWRHKISLLVLKSISLVSCAHWWNALLKEKFSILRGHVIFSIYFASSCLNKFMSNPASLTGSHVINLPAKKYPLTVPRLDLNMACKKLKSKYFSHIYITRFSK